MHIGANWRILWNNPCAAAAMRPCQITVTTCFTFPRDECEVLRYAACLICLSVRTSRKPHFQTSHIHKPSRNLKKKCLPTLYYAMEVCPLNKAHTSSLDFAVGSCFSQVFCAKSREAIAQCMQFFNCQCVKHVAVKRRHRFIGNILRPPSRKGLCKLFI